MEKKIGITVIIIGFKDQHTSESINGYYEMKKVNRMIFSESLGHALWELTKLVEQLPQETNIVHVGGEHAELFAHVARNLYPELDVVEIDLKSIVPSLSS